MAKTHRVQGDLQLLGIAFMGNDQSTGTTRTITLAGAEADIGLDINVKGTGTVRVPVDYEDNIADDRDLVNLGYVKGKLGGVTLDALVQAPTEDEDGYSIVYDHATTSYKLLPGGSFTFDDGLTESGGVVKIGGDIDDAETNLTVTAAGVLRVRSRFTDASNEAGLEVTGVALNNNTARFYAAGGSILASSTALTVTAPGDGSMKYAANYASVFTSDRSIVDRGWVNTHLAGKELGAPLLAPDADEDGYNIVYDHSSGKFTLQAPESVGDLFWKTNDDTTIQTNIGILLPEGRTMFFSLTSVDEEDLTYCEFLPGALSFSTTDDATDTSSSVDLLSGSGILQTSDADEISVIGTTLSSIYMSFTEPTNTMRRVKLRRFSGGPAAGIGSGFEFMTEVALNDGTEVTGGYLDVISTDLTAGAEKFKYSVSLQHNGVVGEKFSIDSTGLIRGVFTEDADKTKILAIDDDGDIYWRSSQAFTDPYAVFKDVSAATYTFLEEDHYKIIRFTHATGCAATIPIDMPLGWTVTAYRGDGAGPVTFVEDTDVTLESTGATLDTQKTAATIIHRGTDIYIAVGAIGEAGSGGGDYWPLNNSASLLGDVTIDFVEHTVTFELGGAEKNVVFTHGSLGGGSINVGVPTNGLSHTSITNTGLSISIPGSDTYLILNDTGLFWNDTVDSVEFTQSETKSFTFNNKVFFTSESDNAPINIGSTSGLDGDVSAVNGDIWYDGINHKLRTRENGINKDLTDPFLTIEDVSTTTYTFVAADHHKIKRFTHVDGCTATVPTGLRTGWLTTAYLAVGAGTLTIDSANLEATAATLDLPKTAATILHRGSDIHVALGALGAGVGITNTAAENELMKSDGENAVPSGLFSLSDADLTMGDDSIAGASRTIQASGSAADVGINVYAKGSGDIWLDGGATTQIALRGLDVNSAVTVQGSASLATALMVEDASGDDLFKVGYDGVIQGTFTQDDDLTKMIVADADGNLFWRDADTVKGTSGAYVPTSTNITNVTDSNPVIVQWARIADFVMFTGLITVNPIALGTSQLRFTLPVATTFTITNELVGTAIAQNNSGDMGILQANVATGEARLIIEHTDPGLGPLTYHIVAGYQVL